MTFFILSYISTFAHLILKMMKKLILSVLLIGILLACNTNPDGFKIEGALSGEVENGTQVFLKKTDEANQLIEVDTTTIENGKFEFSGASGMPELHYLIVNSVRGNIPIVIENGNIEVNAQKDSLGYAKIKGTLQNDLFADFLEESRDMSKRAKSMSDEMRNASAIQDTATMAS